MIRNPIWKDTYYEFDSNDKRFRLSVNGDVIYEGRAKARPGSENARICINKICQNYLNNTLEGVNITTPSTVVHNDAVVVFELYGYNSPLDIWTLLETIVFLYDWDNEYAVNMSADKVLSIPVNQHYADNQIIPTTTYSSSLNRVSTQLRYRTSSEKLYCGDYSLLYRNLAGGWDSFLFEGKCRKSDGFKYQQMEKDYNNNPTNGYEFGKITYLNEITHKWELNTGFLSDVEGERFVRQLCSSTECYLQDLRKGLIYPVVITDTEAKYKRYLIDGSEPVFYKINVESSQKNIELK